MTGQNLNITAQDESDPLLLVDSAEDDRIEERAWVEVSDDVPDTAAALAVVTTAYHEEDLAEGESYFAGGAQQWLRPFPREEGDECQRWNFCEADDEGARLFWVVEVSA